MTCELLVGRSGSAWRVGSQIAWWWLPGFWALAGVTAGQGTHSIPGIYTQFNFTTTMTLKETNLALYPCFTLCRNQVALKKVKLYFTFMLLSRYARGIFLLNVTLVTCSFPSAKLPCFRVFLCFQITLDLYRTSFTFRRGF